MVAVDGVVFFQVIDAAKAAYEVSDLYTAHHGALDDQPAHRHGLDGPRRDAVQARRDQCPAAGRGRPCDRAVGRQDHPRRAEGHPAAAGHRQRHDPADEGRARKARRRSSNPKACASPKSSAPRAKSRRESSRRKGRRRPPSATPKRANAPPGRSQCDQVGQRRDRGRQQPGDQLFHRPEICRGARQVRHLAQCQDDPVPGRGDPADGHARRHRRAGPRSVRRQRQGHPGDHAAKAVRQPCPKANR